VLNMRIHQHAVQQTVPTNKVLLVLLIKLNE
jgi:hypothetical protein